MKKSLIKVLIFIILSFQIFQTKAGLKELEKQLNPGVGAYLKLFVQSNLSNITFLNKLVQVITSDINKYTPKQQAALLYFKELIKQSLTNPGTGGGIVAGNIPTPVANNGKIPFSSSFVKVDSLGNVQVNKGGKWEYFFPICLYHDEHRPVDGPNGRSAYSRGGRFNCIMAWDAGFVKNAKRHGLMSVLQLVQYADGGELGGQLPAQLTKIRQMGLQKDLLFLHVDNERDNSADWVKQLFRKYKRIADQYDKDPTTGKRMHPIYYLNGNTGDALKQDAMGMVSDLTGSYSYERWFSEAENGPTKIITLEHNGTKQPVTFAELNYGVGGDSAHRQPIGRKMTPIAMASVAVGARGIAYWRDGGSTGLPIEKHGFRNDLAIFSRDIHKLMNLGIIQQPDNPFKANCGQSDSAQIGAGTRKLNGVGYVIISNWNSGAKNVSCNIQGLGYTPRGLIDVLKGGSGGTVSGNNITVNVPAYHRRVVQLSK